MNAYKIWYPIFGYYLHQTFNTVEEAKKYAFSKGYSFWIVNDFDGTVEYKSPSII